MDGPPLPFTLYIWPSAWSLPSIDPECIAAVLFLHSHYPGQFAVVECADPDLSPSGKLPFLVHYLHTVSPLPAIISYLSNLDHPTRQGASKPSTNPRLSSREKQQTAAWTAYVESRLADLVSLTLYGTRQNYYQLTRPALARCMRLPMRYYVPDRIQALHTAKLQRIGWEGPQEDVDETALRAKAAQREQTEEEFRRTFEAERHMEKARPIFDDVAQLLGDNEFFFQDRPTTLDFVLASHIALILIPPFPQAHLSRLLRASYANLFTHTKRVLALLPPFDELSKLPSPTPSVFAPVLRTLSAVPVGVRRMTSKPLFSEHKDVNTPTPEGILSVGNLLWGGLALAATLAYAISAGWVELPSVGLADGDELVEKRGVVGDDEAVMDEIVLEGFIG